MARAKTAKPKGNGHFSMPPVTVGANPRQKVLDKALLHAKLRGAEDEGFPAAEALIALPVNGCKWPIGEVRQAGFKFCGCERELTVPYCPPHMAKPCRGSSP